MGKLDTILLTETNPKKISKLLRKKKSYLKNHDYYFFSFWRNSNFERKFQTVIFAGWQKKCSLSEEEMWFELKGSSRVEKKMETWLNTHTVTLNDTKRVRTLDLD